MKNLLLLLIPVCFVSAIALQSSSFSDDNPPKKVVKTDAEWKKALTPDQYTVLREHGTERPNTSPLLSVHDHGTFIALVVIARCSRPIPSLSRERAGLASTPLLRKMP